MDEKHANHTWSGINWLVAGTIRTVQHDVVYFMAIGSNTTNDIRLMAKQEPVESIKKEYY